MKIHLYVLSFLCTLVIIIPTHLIVQATIEDNESSFINSYEEDITGDGFREYFKLQGTLLSKNSNYYRDVWLTITSPFSEQWKISFDSGYDPKLHLIDLNHDHTFDLLYEVAKNENQKQFHYQLYTLKNGSITKMSLPKHNYIRGKFMDDFKVNIQIDPNKKPIILDVSHLKDKYVQHEVYDQDGNLLAERKLIINQPSYIELTLISESKGYGLKSIQSIKGMDDEDIIGNIETLWYFKDNKWIILKSEWTT